MKIGVAVYDQDRSYQEKLVAAIKDAYSDKLDVYSCEDGDKILSCVTTNRADILMVGQETEMKEDSIPETCGLIILSESKESQTERSRFDVPKICRYDAVEDIAKLAYIYGNRYRDLAEGKKIFKSLEHAKQVEAVREEEAERRISELGAELKAQAEEAERVAREEAEERERVAREEAEKRAAEEKLRNRRSHPDIYVFVSAQKGDGALTVSTAVSMATAEREGISVLYLDLSKENAMEKIYSTGSASRDFGDALRKASEGELTGEFLKQFVARDPNTGVDCIYNLNTSFEIMMLGREGAKNLMKAVGEMASYDVVIVNLESEMSITNFAMYDIAKKTMIVSTGQKDSNAKVEKLVEAIGKYDDIAKLYIAKAKAKAAEAGEEFDEPNRENIIGRVFIFYNKFANRTSTTLKLLGVEPYGVLSVLKERTNQKLLLNMTGQDLIKNLVD